MSYSPMHRAQADSAATVLMALGSMARIDPKGPGLLPCRIHNFFRGLPGLWVCMDAACSGLAEDERSGICGKMYSQPRERCECGARVHRTLYVPVLRNGLCACVYRRRG